MAEVRRALLSHLEDHYSLYGEFTGVRTARKHIGWYVRDLPEGQAFRERMNLLEDAQAQSSALANFLDDLAQRMERMPQVLTLKARDLALESLE